MAPDGTFWNANTGAVGHYDSQGVNLNDGFSTSSAFNPSQLGVDATRLYLSYPTTGSGDGVAAYSLSGGSGQTPSILDGGTSSRYDGQAYLRVVGNTLFLPTGQRNKIGLVDLSTFSTSPYYPQTWYGEDINDGSPPMNPAWEACALDQTGPVNGSPANCGTYGDPSSTILSYPVDVAVGPAGSLFVLNNGAGDVEMLTAGKTSGYVPGASFGSSGSGSGQLSSPSSIVRDTTSGDFFIADSGNDRISEFDDRGAFRASFGYGVLDGDNAWEACGVGIGTGACLPGLTYYYNQLAINNGQLFAEGIGPDGVRGQIQVLNLSNGTASTPTPTPTPTTPGPTPTTPIASSPPASSPPASSPPAPSPPAPSTTPTTPAPPRTTVRLKADHTLVQPSQRARLTATVGPSSTCASRTVVFQVLRSHTWVTVSRARVGRHCTASGTSPTVTGATKLRAIVLGPTHKQLATSSVLVVKPRN